VLLALTPEILVSDANETPQRIENKIIPSGLSVTGPAGDIRRFVVDAR
jgi:hypothetical protein